MAALAGRIRNRNRLAQRGAWLLKKPLHPFAFPGSLRRLSRPTGRRRLAAGGDWLGPFAKLTTQILVSKPECHGTIPAPLHSHRGSPQASADVGALDSVCLPVELNRVIVFHLAALDMAQDRCQVVMLL